jgi:outer membrane immunogenic protein
MRFHASVALVSFLAASTLANAADAPPYAVSVYVPPAFSWTGLYLGGNVGGARNQGYLIDTSFGLNFSNKDHVIGGGQLGINWQLSNFLLGLEWEFDGVSNNTAEQFVLGIGTVQVTSNSNWITTLAARFGIAYGYWLFYGKAGGARVGNNKFTITNVTSGVQISGLNSDSKSRLLLGAGIEWAFAPNWSGKVEYDYLGTDSRTFTVPAGSAFLANDTFTTGGQNIQMVKVGINYLLNWIGY